VGIGCGYVSLAALCERNPPSLEKIKCILIDEFSLSGKVWAHKTSLTPKPGPS